MARPQPSRPTALIVEDDHLIALDLERAMADLGYEVCLAASEGRARFLAMQRYPDIVLMDACLGREGIETGRWLRAVCGTSVVFRYIRGGCKNGSAHPRAGAWSARCIKALPPR